MLRTRTHKRTQICERSNRHISTDSDEQAWFALTPDAAKEVKSPVCNRCPCSVANLWQSAGNGRQSASNSDKATRATFPCSVYLNDCISLPRVLNEGR